MRACAATPPPRYDEAITDFITDNAENPFFLYVPFNQCVTYVADFCSLLEADTSPLFPPGSSVHTTLLDQVDQQYSGCQFRGVSHRGRFGDAVSTRVEPS
jgi:hypothetical protein